MDYPRLLFFVSQSDLLQRINANRFVSGDKGAVTSGADDTTTEEEADDDQGGLNPEYAEGEAVGAVEEEEEEDAYAMGEQDINTVSDLESVDF